MKFKRLLAKSLPDQEPKHSRASKAAGYAGHSALVLQAAEVMINHLGATILKQLGLTVDLEYFANTVRLGAYLHDWGKANQHFQEMIYLSIAQKSKDPKKLKHLERLREQAKEHGGEQMLRHEVLSGILALRVLSFRKWLELCPNADLMTAVWAAIGHHLKMKPDISIPDKIGNSLLIYTHHPDFRAVLKMGKRLGLPTTLPELPQELWSKDQIKKELDTLCDEFAQIQLDMDELKTKNADRLKFIAAVKATVTAADLAGSALPAVGENLKGWIQEVLNTVLCGAEIQKLLVQRLGNNTLRPFQMQIAQTPHRVTLVRGGCGTGKTAGAYKWAQQWAVNRKLFFCYPTTGTATQGFLDYAHETEIEAALMHSRSDLDREILFSGDSDEGIEARLDALQAWRKKLIVCTVDTVLGLIQNNRRSLYSWPAIAQSAFVFDEVHAYDDRLFGALLCFLKTFRGAPILLMSASFTRTQVEAIQRVMTELGEETQVIEGPRNLEVLPRYFIQPVPTTSSCWSAVLKTLEKKEHNKVLWVTNSVSSCRELYEQALTHIPPSILLLIYHSRYRYFDRLLKHKAVIDAFNSDGPVLAITTQVCELSLDLSADLLVSAIAPASALIQRMGRLNRRVITTVDGKVKLASGRIGSSLVYPWDNQLPYSKEELITGQQLVDQLAGRDICQENLSEVAAQLSSTTQAPCRSEWLEGYWCTRPDFLRESGYTITVLLEQDLADIKKAANERKDKSFKKERQRWTVPIRIMNGFENWRRNGFYPIAPKNRVEYSALTGAKEL